MACGIDRQAVPPSVTAQLPAVNNVVGLLRGKKRRSGEQAAEKGRGRKGPGKKAKAVLHGHGKSPKAMRKEYHLPIAWRTSQPSRPRPDRITLKAASCKRLRGFHLRIVLSNIGTYGDTNPLIAIALELKRRGHVPVMALPEVYEPRVRPLGLEFHAVRRTSTPPTRFSWR